MYFINVSFDHLPMIMMTKTGTPPRYIAITAPDLMEVVPTSCGSMWRCSGRYADVASPRVGVMFVAVTYLMRLC